MPNNLAWVNNTIPNLERCGHKCYNEKLFFLINFFSLLSFPFFLLSLSSSFFFYRLVSLFSITSSFLSLSPLTHLSLSQPHHPTTSSGHTSDIASPSQQPYRPWIATLVTLPHPSRHPMPPNVSLIYELGFFGFVCVLGWVLRSEFLKLLVVCGGCVDFNWGVAAGFGGW